MKQRLVTKITSENWIEEMTGAFAAGELRKAAEIYDEAKDTSPETQLLRARIFLKHNDPAAAIQLLDKLKGALPENLAHRRDMFLGSAYARIGDFALADRHFERAAQTDTADLRAEIAYYKAARHVFAKEFDQARKELSVAYSAYNLERDIEALQMDSFILSSEQRYHDQATTLIRLLDRIDPTSTQFMEIRAFATHTLAGLARELYIPEAIPAVTKQLGGAPWPEDFAINRFQALKALGWWHALQGDYFNAFRFLKQATAIAPDNAYKTIAAADRAYLAKSIGEARWSRQELDEAEISAETVDWKSTNSEERVGLLLLAELFSAVDASRSAYYVARYRELGDIKSPLLNFKHDDRAQALADYSSGVVEVARGEQKDGLRLLHASLDVFNRIGYDWRAARCLIRIYEANRNSHMLGMAREKLRNYPSSWLSEEIQTLAKENIGARTILPPMQQRVFEALCEGLSTIDIAERLQRSPFTVRNHIKEIFKAFNVTSRSALVAEAARRSLI